MDLDETWQVGLRPEKLSLARFRRNRATVFGESAKKWVAEALLLFFVTCTTHNLCHCPWIDFRQTFHEHEKPPFSGYFRVLFVLSLRVTGNVLRRLHSFHPLVDIPQIQVATVE